MRRLLFSIRKLLFHHRAESELDEETRFHLDMSIQEKMNAGLSEEEARREGLHEFGGIEQVKEEIRERWGMRIVHKTIRDLRFGARMLLRNPGLSILSICALAIGMGQAVTMFSVINGTIFAGLPFEESEDLYTVFWGGPTERARRLQALDFLEFQKQQSVFEEIASHHYWPSNVIFEDLPEVVPSGIVTSNFFRVLKEQPIRGIGFPDEETLRDDAPVVVIGYSLWQRHFAGSEDIIGRKLMIDRRSHTITGVMREGFGFPYGNQEMWRIDRQHPETIPKEGRVNRGVSKSMVVGRLSSEAQRESAVADWNVIAQRLAVQYADTNKALTKVRIDPLSEYYLEGSVLTLWSMQAAAVLVVVISCVNVAALILANLSRRTGEIAIRTSVGASRGHLMRQIILESALLAFLGGICGLLIAVVGSKVALRHLSEILWMQSWMHTRLDTGSVIVVLLAVGATAVLSGLFPALQVSKANLNVTLKESEGPGSGFSIGKTLLSLSILQIGISCALLVGTLFLFNIVMRVASLDYPYDPARILHGRIYLYEEGYPEAEDKIAVLDRIEADVTELPGVTAVTYSTAFNPANPRNYWPISPEGESYPDTQSMPHVYWSAVSHSYLETLGVPLLKGRNFGPSERIDTPPVALVNTVFADRFWPGEDPIGKRFREHHNSAAIPQGEWVTIVGLVPDMHEEGLDNPNRDGSCVYRSARQGNFGWLSVMLHCAVENPMAISRPFRRAMANIDPTIQVRGISTTANANRHRSRYPRFIASIFGIFGATALVLSAAGLCGIISFTVRERTRELGVRLALGASRSSIARPILRQVGTMLGIGILLGSLGGYASLQLLKASFSVGQPQRLDYYLIATVVVVLSGLLAVLGPLLRATRMDPMTALREK